MKRLRSEQEETMIETLYFALDLKDEAALIERYKAWHAPGAVPAAINRSIRAAGIEKLEIFLAGNRMVMALTPGPGFDAAKKAAADAADPDVQAWEELMWTFQQALPFAEPGEKWLPMHRIYALSEQP
jgi:L-rhamnose mutarotase